MKKLFLALLAVILISGLVFGGCAQPAPAPGPAPAPKPEPIVLKGVTFLPAQRDTVIAMTMLADRLKEKSNGQLIIDVLGGPEVIGMFDQPAAVQDGTVDIILTPTAFYGNMVPEALGLPVSEYTPWEERDNGFYDWLVELHKEKMGVYYLGRTLHNFGFKAFVTDRINTPKELAGKKLGVTPLFMPFTAALGAAGVMVEEPDMYTALERGVIDGYMLPELSVVELGTTEVTNYAIDHPFYEPNNLVHVVNLDTWNRIPKPLQDLMIEESVKLERDIWNFAGDLLAEAHRQMVEGGTEFITFSPEDAKWYLDLANSSYLEDVRGKVSPENYAKLKEFLTK